MAKIELGAKHTCVSCSAHFYDLQRVPATCPKCGETQPAVTSKMKPYGGNISKVSSRQKAAPASQPLDAVAETDTETDPVEEADRDGETNVVRDDEDDDEGIEVDEIDADLGKGDVEGDR